MYIYIHAFACIYKWHRASGPENGMKGITCKSVPLFEAMSTEWRKNEPLSSSGNFMGCTSPHHGTTGKLSVCHCVSL